jgi:hypothetical protein
MERTKTTKSGGAGNNNFFRPVPEAKNFLDRFMTRVVLKFNKTARDYRNETEAREQYYKEWKQRDIAYKAATKAAAEAQTKIKSLAKASSNKVAPAPSGDAFAQAAKIVKEVDAKYEKFDSLKTKVKSKSRR